LEASRAGVGDYVLNMPLAALNLADAGFRGGVGAFADLIPGLRPAQRMDLAREVAAVPEAMAGSIARAPEALDEGIGALSEVARRMFQEGPVPDRLMSGVDPLAAFRAAREAMLGARRDMSFEELQSLSGRQSAARDAAVAALSEAPSVRLFDRNDRAAVVGPGMGPGEDGRFRVTYFDEDRRPTNHTVYETREEALGAALREGFDSRTADRGPDPLPPPRNAAEEVSDDIARLLREGKVEEAEALLDRADDRRLYRRYERGEVGMDLPMDLESRLGRARELGFVEDEFIGSMEPGIRSLDPRMARGDRRYSGTWSSDNPYVASSYADPRLGSVYPLLTRGLPEDAVRFDARGANWRDLPGYESADIGGQSTGPISVRLANMGEAGMRGQYDTNQVARIAFFEGLPGAEFRNVVDRGPYAPRDPNDPSVLEEFQRRGAEPSLVRARQDTRGVRSRFARFDPRFAGSRNLMAGVAGAGVMVGASGDDEEPAVRGYAQGGEVMMRSNMPEQLHRGIGSLNEVARGMYRGGAVQGFQMGGAVGGHPLDQYGQYLNQRYAEPVQQLAANAVGQFVDSVRQKEQSYFGGGAMGGGGLMGSPMQQPGGMQMAGFNAAQSRNPAPSAPDSSDPRSMLGFGVLQPGTFTAGPSGPSPFGNNLGNQQMMGQRRLDAMQPSGGNDFNAALALQNNGGPMMQSNFDGNRPGATGGQILGTFDIFQMGRNAGIV
jgi:hypothetical protein